MDELLEVLVPLYVGKGRTRMVSPTMWEPNFQSRSASSNDRIVFQLSVSSDLSNPSRWLSYLKGWPMIRCPNAAGDAITFLVEFSYE